MTFKTPIADMHVHSTFSVDGHDTLDAMCRAALERGVAAICFAEHYDLNPAAEEEYNFLQYDRFSAAVDEARRVYGDRLMILKGIEFGEPHIYPRELEWVQTLDVDVVLGSIHWAPDGFVGDRALRDRLGLERLYESYYDQMRQAIRVGGFDVLAHLDFPKRYVGQVTEPPAWLDEVLRETVRAGVVLEINTSPLRKGMDECSPDLPILTRYAQVGGRRVTLGSDAHACADIAAGFDRAQRLAWQAGLGPVGWWQQRRFVASG